MITEFKTIPKAVYYVQTADGCTVLDPDGDTLAEITAPGGYFPGIADADGGPGTVTFSAPVKRVVGPFDLAPQLQLTILGQLGGNAGGLPAGFKRVEYLQSDGGQWMDTKREVTVSTRVECECQLVTSNLAQGAPIGSSWRETDANDNLVALHSAIYFTEYLDKRIFFAFGDKRTLGYAYYPVFERNRIKAENAKLYLNSEKIYDLGDAVASQFDKPLTFYLFGVHTVNKETEHSVTSPYAGRVYGVTIYDGDVKKNEFVPCVNTNTGEPCMYDLVSKTAFKNDGTGQFTVGMTLAQVRGLRLPAGGGKLTLSLPHEASIDRLAQAALEQARANGWELTLQYAEAEVPAGFRKLDFLESTGTQYIDTGVKLSNESEVNCTYSAEKAGGGQCLYGSFIVPRFCTYGAYGGLEDFSFYAYIENLAGKLFPLTLGKKNRVKHASASVIFNDSEQFFAEVEAFTQADVCALYGTISGMRGWFKVYSFTISRAGEMQVDYVPCIAPDGSLGMFNKVDGTMKENAGSGAFIAGLATVDDVRTLWLPETNGELTVSVPADTPDSAVEQLRKNNPTWQIAIQYRQ